MLIDKEDEAAEVLPNIMEPLIIETPFNYQAVILAIPTDVLRGIALDMIRQRVHLNWHSTLHLPQTYALEKVLASLSILFHDNMIGFLFVKESWPFVAVLSDDSLFHLIQIYGVYHIHSILLHLWNAGLKVKMELVVELVIFGLHRGEFNCCLRDFFQHRVKANWLLPIIILNSIGLIGGEVSHELKFVAVSLSQAQLILLNCSLKFRDQLAVGIKFFGKGVASEIGGSLWKSNSIPLQLVNF